MRHGVHAKREPAHDGDAVLRQRRGYIVRHLATVGRGVARPHNSHGQFILRRQRAPYVDHGRRAVDCAQPLGILRIIPCVGRYTAAFDAFELA